MPTGAEILQALYGTWRFARADRNAMRYFDLSHQGVWRSFWAAALAYPLFVALILLRLDAESIERSGRLYILMVQSIGYVVGWTAFPLLVIEFCRRIGRGDKGFEFVVAYNWSQIPQTALLVLVALAIKLVVPPGAGGNLDLIATLAILGYEWFIALVAIGAGGWVAVSVVFLDIAIGSVVMLVAGNLY